MKLIKNKNNLGLDPPSYSTADGRFTIKRVDATRRAPWSVYDNDALALEPMVLFNQTEWSSLKLAARMLRSWIVSQARKPDAAGPGWKMSHKTVLDQAGIGSVISADHVHGSISVSAELHVLRSVRDRREVAIQVAAKGPGVYNALVLTRDSAIALAHALLTVTEA
jgi:hypothetical protein